MSTLLLLLLLVAVPSTSQENRLSFPVQEMRPPSGWYVLVRFDVWSTTSSDSVWSTTSSVTSLKRAAPQPVGPYPSEEMCRLAARVLMPDDRQFWPAAEKDAADLKEKEALALRAIQVAAELAEIRARPLAQRRNRTIVLLDGSSIQFDKVGKEVDGDFMTIATASGMFTGPRFIAESRCLHVR